MFKNTVKLQSLIGALMKLGFEERRRNGGNALYQHVKTGVVISLPLVEDNVRTIIFRAILSQIVGLGVATEDQFLKLLQA